MSDLSQLHNELHKTSTDKEVVVQLHPEDLEALVELLGQLPTESNAWPLYMRLNEQLNNI